MSFITDLKSCLKNAGLPIPDKLPDLSISEILEVVDEIHDAAENSGVDTFAALATLLTGGGAAALGVSAVAVEVVTDIAAVAGSFGIGVYLGATLSCSAKIVAAQLSLQTELASAEPGFAKQQVDAELATIEQTSVPV